MCKFFVITISLFILNFNIAFCYYPIEDRVFFTEVEDSNKIFIKNLLKIEVKTARFGEACVVKVINIKRHDYLRLKSIFKTVIKSKIKLSLNEDKNNRHREILKDSLKNMTEEFDELKFIQRKHVKRIHRAVDIRISSNDHRELWHLVKISGWAMAYLYVFFHGGKIFWTPPNTNSFQAFHNDSTPKFNEINRNPIRSFNKAAQQ